MTPEAQQPGSEAGHAPAGNHTAIPFENPATGVEFLQNCHRDVPEIPRFQMAAMVLSAGIHFFGASFFFGLGHLSHSVGADAAINAVCDLR
jgi:hypothetical protein